MCQIINKYATAKILTKYTHGDPRLKLPEEILQCHPDFSEKEYYKIRVNTIYYASITNCYDYTNSFKIEVVRECDKFDFPDCASDESVFVIKFLDKLLLLDVDMPFFNYNSPDNKTMEYITLYITDEYQPKESIPFFTAALYDSANNKLLTNIAVGKELKLSEKHHTNQANHTIKIIAGPHAYYKNLNVYTCVYISDTPDISVSNENEPWLDCKFVSKYVDLV